LVQKSLGSSPSETTLSLSEMKGFFYAYWFFEFGCDLVGTVFGTD